MGTSILNPAVPYPPVDRVDLIEGSPSGPGNGLSRFSRQGGLVGVTSENGGFQALALADWKDYWQATLGLKVGALPQSWHCPWSSDFVGAFDFAPSLAGGVNTDTAGTGPGVRVGACTPASGPTAFVNYSNPGNNIPLIDDWKLRRWACVQRFKLPTAPNANTRIHFGLVNIAAAANVGFGSVGSVSASLLTSINGGGNSSFPAGTALSAKASDPNNFVWGYLYNDLYNIWFSVDGEADKLVCATSTLTAGQAAFWQAGNFPAGGTTPESLQIDKAAVFTEL